MSDKYLDKLKKFETSEKNFGQRREFEKGYKSTVGDFGREIYYPVKVDGMDPEMKGKYLGDASRLMSYAIKTGDSYRAIQALEIYKRFGVANRSSVKNRLLKALESAKKDKNFYEQSLPKARNFFEESKNKPQDLTKKLFGLGAVAGFVFSLFFLSSNVTGNVIGNAGASSNNVAGIITLTASFLLAFLALRK